MKNNNLKPAVGYICIPKNKELNGAVPIVDQRNAILTYASDHGYEIRGWYEDEISNSWDNKPEWNSLLNDATVCFPAVRAIIVFRNDFVTKDVNKYLYCMYLLNHKNVKLFPVTVKLDEGEHEINDIRHILESAAQCQN